MSPEDLLNQERNKCTECGSPIGVITLPDGKTAPVCTACQSDADSLPQIVKDQIAAMQSVSKAAFR